MAYDRVFTKQTKDTWKDTLKDNFWEHRKQTIIKKNILQTSNKVMSNFVRLEEFQVIGMYQLDTEFGGSKQHYSLLSYLKIHISSYTNIKPNKAVYS